MVGRKPKPSAIREIEGNRGHRPINQNEPKPIGVPTCPSHLDATAKREWTRISKELIGLGLLTNVDRAFLATYCAAWSRWVEAEKQIQKFGLVIKSPKSGYPVPNPYVSIANTSWDAMRKFGTEFGLSPASRTRLSVDNAPAGDPFADFMASIGATTNDDSHTADED